jgi:hypothetical protein
MIHIIGPELMVKDPMFYTIGIESTEYGSAVIEVMPNGWEWFECSFFAEELDGALLCSAHTFYVEGAEECVGHAGFAIGRRDTKVVHNAGLVAFIEAGVFTEYTSNKTAVVGSRTYTNPGAIAESLLQEGLWESHFNW